MGSGLNRGIGPSLSQKEGGTNLLGSRFAIVEDRLGLAGYQVYTRFQPALPEKAILSLNQQKLVCQ